ncbi:MULTISPECIES: hypothetical protein [Clostridium]|uniref:Uncharacterized protein n=1 Tax=Clostridium cibarium TaxID=2762247 RepID=A0ABR8PW20_9CLOT|nr:MULTISPECIES: hypothetical protein [Clostridium]MBD7912377.1 hypothetical protein [Clostridium cibarium]
MKKDRLTQGNENNKSSKDWNQFLIELGWSNREILSGHIALYTIIQSIIVRHTRRAILLDDINGTNYKNDPQATCILKKYPGLITGTLLVLAINSVEVSFEQLVNAYSLGKATKQELRDLQDSLISSFFAYVAAKISHEIESRAPFY